MGPSSSVCSLNAMPAVDDRPATARAWPCALDKGQRPLILAVELKQVEGIAVPGMAAAD